MLAQSRRHQFHFRTKPVLKLVGGNQGKNPGFGGHLEFLLWLSSRLTSGWSEFWDCVMLGCTPGTVSPSMPAPPLVSFSFIPNRNQYCWCCQECLLLTKVISSLQQVSSHCWQLGYKPLCSVKLPASSTVEISRSETFCTQLQFKKKRQCSVYHLCSLQLISLQLIFLQLINSTILGLSL